jgi:superoxide reductase
MTKIIEIYKCNFCGNVVEVIHAGVGQLVCCGQPMELMKEKNRDVGAEKHVPVLEKMRNILKVKVGELPHPMEEKHYIEWIEIIADGVVHRKFLKPGDKPEAEFEVAPKKLAVRAYCNVHGLWVK